MPYTASMPSAIITINYQDLVVGIPFGPLLYGCKSLVLPSFAYIIGVDLMKSVLKMTYWCEGIILPFSKYKRFDLVPIASLFAFEKYLVSLTSAKKLNFVFACSHVLRKYTTRTRKQEAAIGFHLVASMKTFLNFLVVPQSAVKAYMREWWQSYGQVL